MDNRPQAARVRAGPAPSLEAEVGRLEARLAAVEREKADLEAFAAAAAHELLAPLVVAEVYATTVSERLDEARDAESLRELDALRRAVGRTRLLVETLLQDARSQGRELRRGPVDLNMLLRECLMLLAPEIRSRGTEVRIAELTPPLPGHPGLDVRSGPGVGARRRERSRRRAFRGVEGRPSCRGRETRRSGILHTGSHRGRRRGR